MNRGFAVIRERQREQMLARIEDFRFLRGRGLSAAQIARRLGVSVRTVERYKARERGLA